MGGPPPASTRFRFPAEKNPRVRPSGDQKGWSAPSVPAIGTASSDERSRTNSCAVTASLPPTPQTRRPSGEDAGHQDTAPGPARRPAGGAGGAENRPLPSGRLHVNRVGASAGEPTGEAPRVRHVP